MAPTLHGVPLSEARRRIGLLAQLARAEQLTVEQGPARSSRRIHVDSGGGLTFDLLPDRALDIGAASFLGVPLAWHSPTGFVAPGLVENRGTEWLRGFGGGLLATCGLDAYGPPSSDAGVDFPMHGRVGSVPATVTRCEITEEGVFVEGLVRQTTVFGENLLLHRKIHVPLGGASVQLTDTVTNEGSTDSGHMILYHANFGWPLLDERATLSIPSKAVSPRDEAAEQGLADWFTITPPSRGYAEQVFRHDFSGVENAEVSIDNPHAGVCVRLSFDSQTLGALHQWKMMGEGHYVLGLEPTNVDWSRGRADAAHEGALPMLAPGESATYRLAFECGPSAQEPGSSGRRS